VIEDLRRETGRQDDRREAHGSEQCRLICKSLSFPI